MAFLPSSETRKSEPSGSSIWFSFFGLLAFFWQLYGGHVSLLCLIVFLHQEKSFEKVDGRFDGSNIALAETQLLHLLLNGARDLLRGT